MGGDIFLVIEDPLAELLHFAVVLQFDTHLITY